MEDSGGISFRLALFLFLLQPRTVAFLLLLLVIICPCRRKSTRQLPPPHAPDGRGHLKGQMTGEANAQVSLPGGCRQLKGPGRAGDSAPVVDRRPPGGKDVCRFSLRKAGRDTSEGQGNLSAQSSWQGEGSNPGAIPGKTVFPKQLFLGISF